MLSVEIVMIINANVVVVVAGAVLVQMISEQ